MMKDVSQSHSRRVRASRSWRPLSPRILSGRLPLKGGRCSRRRPSSWRRQMRYATGWCPTSPNRLNIPSMTLTWLVYAAYGDGGFNTSMRVTEVRSGSIGRPLPSKLSRGSATPQQGG